MADFVDEITKPIRVVIDFVIRIDWKEVLKTVISLVVGFAGTIACGTITATGIGVVLAPLCVLSVSVVTSAIPPLIDFLDCLSKRTDSNSPVCTFNVTGKDGFVENLAWDIVLNTLTFGLGKAFTKFSKIKVGNVEKAIETGQNGAKVVDNEVAKALKCTGSTCIKAGACFIAGTLILVATFGTSLLSTPVLAGYNKNVTTKSIESIKRGDIVVSRDQYELSNDKPTIFSKVKRTFQKQVNQLQSITLVNNSNQNTNTITTTPNHPFYQESTKEFVNASNLKVGDKVSNGQLTVSKNIETVAALTKVFNFEVEVSHTYYVSNSLDNNNFVWVHNDCALLQPFVNSITNTTKVSKAFVEKLSESTVKWLAKGNAEYQVYVLKDKLGNVVYTGITSIGTDKRLAQHLAAGKEFIKLESGEISKIFGGNIEKLTRSQARAVEQTIMNKYNLVNSLDGLNLINSIGNNRSIYNEAVQFGEEVLKVGNIIIK